MDDAEPAVKVDQAAQTNRVEQADQADIGRPVGRRIILGLLGLGAAGVVTGKPVQNALMAVLAPVESRDPTGLVSLLPVGDSFRFYSVTGGVINKSSANYQLAVTGLVDRPMNHSFQQLMSMQQTSLVKDFQCVTGWRVPGVKWSGVLLSDLLDASGVKSTAKAVRLKSFDGTYTESLTLAQARRSDVLVALQMLGAPVTHDHGGPVRLFVAPMYGYKSLKWLSEIELTDAVVPGYWEDLGYDVDGWVGGSNGRDDPKTSG